MELGERAEEALETLWIAIEERGESGVAPHSIGRRESDRLVKAGLAAVSDGQLVLTETGMPQARSVVRRHRLAERLLHDVLGTGESLMHERACKFEHLLDRGLDESICTLLGHPKVCPHGKKIPQGQCCLEEQMEATQLVAPLSQLTAGDRGKVAYIYAPEAEKLQKLIAMGILPGAPIRLAQKSPSFVFDAGHTQFAVDEQIADTIYVRLIREESEVPQENGTVNGRSRHGSRSGRFLGLW